MNDAQKDLLAYYMSICPRDPEGAYLFTEEFSKAVRRLYDALEDAL